MPIRHRIWLLVNNDLETVSQFFYRGKIRIISAVPSLDTPVYDLEIIFGDSNSEAGALGDDVAIMTVSMDLQIAQKIWFGAAGVDKVITVSASW